MQFNFYLYNAARTSIGLVQKPSPNETYCTAVKIGKLPMGMAVPLIVLHMFWITFKKNQF